MKLFSNFKKVSVFTIFVFFAIFIFSNKTEASVTDNVFGNAWNYNVGWVSFNSCENPADENTCGSINYGVVKDGTTVSGYAWSDNIGWISFNPTDWGTCPPDAGGCNLSTYTNNWSNGWARAMSVPQANGVNLGGWDGWISLGGGSYGASVGTTDVGPDFNFNFKVYEVTGYWWGSDVLGWFDLNKGSSYDLDEGGVFVADLTTAALTLTPNKSSVVDGDPVTFTWVTVGFTPTSCTGSGGGSTSPWPDTNWTTTKTGITAKTGTYNFINPPHGATTDFTLSCTDGTYTAQATTSITSAPLTAGLSYNNSCVAVGGNTPIVSWSTNDLSPLCNIEAETTDGMSTYDFDTQGSSPGTIDDVDYEFKNTYYTMTCENGNGAYKATAVSPQISVNMCLPNFSITGPTCKGAIGAVMSNTGSQYEGSVVLTLNPTNGFTSNASVSVNSSPTGTFTNNPSNFTYTSTNTPKYNTVTANLVLTPAQYTTLMGSMNPPNSGILTKALLDITSSGQGVGTKSVWVNFCTDGTNPSNVNPIYKPF